MLTNLTHIAVIDILPADLFVYFCKVYYENISPLEWSVRLCIVRRLNVLEEVLYILIISILNIYCFSI